jgi:hypothetical protein
MSHTEYTKNLTMNLTGNVASVKNLMESDVRSKLEEVLKILRKLEVKADIQAKNINFMGKEIKLNTEELSTLKAGYRKTPAHEPTHPLPPKPEPPAIPKRTAPAVKEKRVTRAEGKIQEVQLLKRTDEGNPGETNTKRAAGLEATKRILDQSNPPRFGSEESSAGNVPAPEGDSSQGGSWAERARKASGLQVVVESRRGPKADAAPGIQKQRINPNRRVMVIRTSPTRDIFNREKVRTAINKRLEVSKAKWIVVAVYGSQGGDLTLHISDNATANDALKNPFARAIEQGLNDVGYFGFELSADAEKVKLFVAGVSLGKDWDPSHWTDAKYAQLWEEIRASNPKLEIPFLPSFCGTMLNIHKSGRTRAGLILTVLRNQAAIETLRAGFVYLHGRTHVVKEFVDRYHSQVCDRCLRQGHNSTVCRDQARCRFCGGPHASANHTCGVGFCTAKRKNVQPHGTHVRGL